MTPASLALLGPLAFDVIKAVGTDTWEAVLGVFVLTYVLLVRAAVLADSSGDPKSVRRSTMRHVKSRCDHSRCHSTLKNRPNE